MGWSVADGTQALRLNHGSTVTQVEVMLLPDSPPRFVTAGDGGLLKVWDPNNPSKELLQLRTSANLIALAYDRQGGRLTTLGFDLLAAAKAAPGQYRNEVDSWPTAAIQAVLPFPHELQLPGMVTALTFSLRGDRLAVGTAPLDPSAGPGAFVLWETGGWRQLLREAQINLAAAFSPDGRQVAAAMASAVDLWDATNGQPLTHMKQDGEAATTGVLAFTPDGSHLATAVGGSLRIWDLAGGEVARREHRGGETIWDLAFSPDGTWVATGSSDGTAAPWLWRPADLIADACARLPRSLTRAEWNSYVGKEVPYHATCPRLPADGD